MEPTLEASVARIFGNPTSAPTDLAQTPQQISLVGETPAAKPEADAQSLAARARQQYDRALQAQREGDWTSYGEEIKQLGAVLERMSRQK